MKPDEQARTNLAEIAAREPDQYRTVWIRGEAYGNCIGLTVAERDALVAVAQRALEYVRCGDEALDRHLLRIVREVVARNIVDSPEG